MSGTTTKRKTMRVQLPAVNLDLLGQRDDVEVSGQVVNEEERQPTQKQKLLEDLNLEADILDARERVKTKRESLEGSTAKTQTQSTGDRITEEVFIPMVKKQIEGQGSASDATNERALRIAEAALNKGKGGQGSPLDDLSKGISVLRELKTFIAEESPKSPPGPPTTGGDQVDPITQLERGIEMAERLKKLYPSQGGGSDAFSQASIDFQKWSKQYDADQKQRDRAFQLAIRKQDKDHEAKIAELGIKQETNELFKGALKTIGRAVAKGLTGEEGLEEVAGVEAAKGRKETVEMVCPNPECGKTLIIPPEAQVQGREIKCTYCNSILAWKDNPNA